MIDPQDRENLIAYLEARSRKGEAANLPMDLALQLLNAMNAASYEQRSGGKMLVENFAFHIGEWDLDGTLKGRLGGSDDERIGRRMFVEAVRQLPGRRITLTNGADILQDSCCNKAA
jgi:hypothetical protein